MNIIWAQRRDPILENETSITRSGVFEANALLVHILRSAGNARTPKYRLRSHKNTPLLGQLVGHSYPILEMLRYPGKKCVLFVPSH